MDKKGVNKWYKFFGLLIFVIFIYIIFNKFALDYIIKILPERYADLIENIIILVLVIILNYLLVSFSSKLLKEYWINKSEKRDVKLLLSVFKYFEWFLVIFITLSILFEQLGSLITSIGLIGFGITFALQKPILNFVGWITIVFSKTYKIGDMISINNLHGRVYDVKVMYTDVSEVNDDGDPTGKSISIPNEFVLTTPVINYTKGSGYVWDQIKIFLTYESNWKKALKISEKIVQDYYDKNIKESIKKYFKEEFSYNKVVSRVGMNERGVILKIRYLVEWDNSNELRGEIITILLDKLKAKDIILGKIEDIKSKDYKVFS